MAAGNLLFAPKFAGGGRLLHLLTIVLSIIFLYWPVAKIANSLLGVNCCLLVVTPSNDSGHLGSLRLAASPASTRRKQENCLEPSPFSPERKDLGAD